ncbi:hypothetical protein CBS147338_9300 [Penicillium roqueforti]|nr:hypothetical protein CBS147338_9300 [Penicillium roqueforti]
MPLFRMKTVFPLVALVTIGIFFFCMERYDRSAFLRFKHPIDRASFSGNKQPQVQTSAQSDSQQPASNTCEADPKLAAPHNIPEYIPHKNNNTAKLHTTNLKTRTN